MNVDWKAISEMMATECNDMIKHYRVVIRVQRGAILALLLFLVWAVIR